MPSLNSLLGRTSEPYPTVQYESVESYWDAKLQLNVQRGQIELGSHPAVRQNPKFWMRRGASPQEIAVARHERGLAGEVEDQPYNRPVSDRARKSRPVERLVVATRTIIGGEPEDGTGYVINAGDRFDADAPRTKAFLKKWPQAFAPVDPEAVA